MLSYLENLSHDIGIWISYSESANCYLNRYQAQDRREEHYRFTSQVLESRRLKEIREILQIIVKCQ